MAFAEQLGWLSATPDDWEQTRREFMAGRGQCLGLPEIHAGAYLIDAMREIGPMRGNGFGAVATDWDIIGPFVEATGRLSEPWEVETLAKMCAAYTSGYNDGKNVLSIAPADRGENV